MKTRVQKWGNSLALRIPKAFAEQVGIADNVLVDISLTDGKLLVIPIVDQPITLDDLLAGITDANIHHEDDTGTLEGNEAW
jgi:antitoxin MazE